MFQEKPEKGLFTFYWEQTYKENKEQQNSHRSQLIQPSQQIGEKYVTSMEEKKIRGKHHKTQKPQPTMKRHQSYLYFQTEKQNKSILIPHMVTLSPRIDQSNVRVDQEEHKLKYFKEFFKQKINEDEKKQKDAIHKPLEKLLFLEQGIQCHKKNLELDETIIPASNSCLNTGRAVKLRKATRREAQINQKISKKQKIPSININQDQLGHSNMFPTLFPSKRSNKKLKKIKESYLLQRIYFEKNTQGKNSVVNIGISSVDDYKQRWRKRKAQFLELLSQSTEERKGK